MYNRVLINSFKHGDIESSVLILPVELFHGLDAGDTQVLLGKGLVIEDAASQLGRGVVEEATVPWVVKSRDQL